MILLDGNGERFLNICKFNQMKERDGDGKTKEIRIGIGKIKEIEIGDGKTKERRIGDGKTREREI